MNAEELNLESLLGSYNAAVETWIVAIRREEAIASSTETVAEVDSWEEAANVEEEARTKVKEAKKNYENALRQKFFHF